MQFSNLPAIFDLTILCVRVLVFVGEFVYGYINSSLTGQVVHFAGPTFIDAILLMLLGISLSGQSTQTDIAGLAASALTIATNSRLLSTVGLVTFGLRFIFRRQPSTEVQRDDYCNSDDYRARIESLSRHNRAFAERFGAFTDDVQRRLAEQPGGLGSRSTRK